MTSATDDASFADGAERPVRLRAMDGDDLQIVSSLVQDAVFPITEMRWQKGQRRFALLLNRFRWEDAPKAERHKRPFERVQSVLSIEDVTSVRSQGIDRSARDVVLSVLAIGFEPGEDGTGTVILTLAGDGAIAVDVETLEVTLRDVTRPYVAPSGRKPEHAGDALGGSAALALASRPDPSGDAAGRPGGPIRLSAGDGDFERRFTALLEMKREDSPDVDDTVAGIIADVRANGDDAVIALTEKFDGMLLTPATLAFTEEEIEAECARVPDAERAALELAAERIRDYHQRQLPEDAEWTDESGARLGWRWSPVAAAGLYVPGGTASYPSSVLMNAIPARVAGVDRLVVTAPTPHGRCNPLVLLAARLSGVETVYRIGGAQAIAALAYGTQTIRPVDKITGPGNAFVAAAKRRVFGKVGIDMIAGPSEILVIADAQNDPDWIALDLLSQAEHDPSAQSILITTDAAFGDAVAAAVEARLRTLERGPIAAQSWYENGAIITVRDLAQAAELSDRIAPEHLELCVADPDALAARIRHAGAIFLGQWTPEAIGDYVGGPNHVLPTARSARFSSGLSVLDFMKRSTMASMTPGALSRIGPAAETLARSESLEAHGLSVRARLNRLNEGR